MTTTPAPSIAAWLLTGTSTGPFPTGFKYGAAGDVRVYLELAGVRQADLTAGDDFTLTGATPEADGGTVTLSATLVPADGWDEAAGDRVVICRRTVKSQSLALPNAEGHKPRATEAALDKLMRASEEQADQIALSLTVPPGEAGPTLPSASSRDGKVAWFSGSAIEGFAINPGEVLGADPATGRPVSIPLQVSVDGSTASVSSRLAAQAASWSEGALFIQAQGHLSAGDGGRALWARVDNQPNHDGKFQSADGAWWEIAEAVIDPLMLGAAGDGAADDRAALALADDAAFALDRPLKITRPLRIASNITIEAPVAFDGAGEIIPDEDVTVQLARQFTAPLRAIFDLSAGGKVILPDSMDEAWAAWWGLDVARTDNEGPLQQAIVALEAYLSDPTSPLDYGGGAVRVHRGDFKVSGPVLMRDNVRLVGSARDYASLNAHAATWSGKRMLRCANWVGEQALITGITQADPAVVTAAGHGFVNGDVVTLENIGGMEEVEDTQFTVANATDDTFELATADAAADPVDSTGYTAFTEGGTATKYRSQFGVRCENLSFHAGGIAEIEEVILAESWNEQCGLKHCLINDFDGVGVKIRKGYGGSAISTIEDTEIQGNLTAQSKNIDVEVSVGFVSTFHDVMLNRVTVTGCEVGVNAANKIRVHANAVHMEDADQGIFLSGEARLCGTGIKASRDCTALIGLDTNWTGRIDALPYVQGPATHVLVDYRTGKSGYTPFDGEFVSRPLSYPFRGEVLFGGLIEAGATPPTPDPDTLLSAVSRTAVGKYQCTLAAGFSLANKANYWGRAWVPGAVDATAFAAFQCELAPLAGNVFAIYVVDGSGAAANPDQLAFEIFHKP